MNAAGPVVVTGPRPRATSVDPAHTVTVHSPTEVSVSRLVSADDPYLEGHYPEFTVYPGAFIVESVYQAVLHLLWRTRGADAWARPVSIDSVRFTGALAPGDTLDVHCACERTAPGRLAATARCTTAGNTAAQVRMTFEVSPSEGGSHA
ncbi:MULTISPECIES: 3-hydroxyacyl-ACP dehydratase FabZ family protein [unclassified Streptomyces]|uniref:3-hydroxyacyl-ACP dehydratase FabZ family protein n=1 Tax=unclassified Streptomyces TaxID=2593676 RepID=UPI002E2728F3